MPLVPPLETDAASLLGDTPIGGVIDSYEQAGAIIVRGLIDDRWLGVLRRIYDDMAKEAWNPNAKGNPQPNVRQLLNRHHMWADVLEFGDFLSHSPIAQAAARLMRSSTARLYEDILITEPARQKAQLGWHQDTPAWPVAGQQLSSVWFSMQPVDAETGAMRFVPGSHRGVLYFPNYLKDADVGDDLRFYNGGPFPTNEDIEERNYVITPLDPGDAVIFHPSILHTSYGSSPEHDRQSFTIRIMGDDVRWQPKKRIFHRWMNELGMNEGDRITSERLPELWSAQGAVPSLT